MTVTTNASFARDAGYGGGTVNFRMLLRGYSLESRGITEKVHIPWSDNNVEFLGGADFPMLRCIAQFNSLAEIDQIRPYAGYSGNLSWPRGNKTATLELVSETAEMLPGGGAECNLEFTVSW